MSSINFKLVSAPHLVDADADGTFEKRVALRYGGESFYETMEVDLGAKAPEIIPIDRGIQAADIARGGARTFRTKPDRIGLRIDMDEISGADLQTLYRMMLAGRPVAFTPWYDPSTFWMSTFGGISEDGFLAEIGYNATTMLIPRNTDDYYPRRGKGYLTRLGVNDRAKFVPGMIGNAILLERDSTNLFTTATPIVAGNTNATAQISGSVPVVGDAYSIYIPDDGGTSFVQAGAALSVTPATDYIASVWARGEGNAVLLANGLLDGDMKGASTELSPTEFRRLRVSFTPTLDSTVTIRIEAASGNEVLAEVKHWQLEAEVGAQANDRPSSYIDPAATSETGDSDQLFIDDTLPRGGGLTLACWLYRDEPEDRGQIFAADDAGTFLFAYFTGANVMRFNMLGPAGDILNPAIAAPSNDWEQFVFVVRRGVASAGQEQAFYHNGVLITSSQSTTGAELRSEFPNGFHIGGSFAPSSTGDFGLNFPLDAFRIDARPWSETEILNDYAMRRESGIQAFLAQTQGRFFEIRKAPGAFLAGLFTDKMEGEIILEQVGVSPMGVVS